MNFPRELLQAILDQADTVLATRYESDEFFDKVLYCEGQAYHLTMERDNPDAKIVLTAISYNHCLKLF